MTGRIWISMFGAALALTLPTVTFAMPLPYVTPSQLKQYCRSNNGTFLPPTKDSPVYVCLGKNTNVICGGIKKYAKTCEIDAFFVKRPIKRRLTAQ